MRLFIDYRRKYDVYSCVKSASPELHNFYRRTYRPTHMLRTETRTLFHDVIVHSLLAVEMFTSIFPNTFFSTLQAAEYHVLNAVLFGSISNVHSLEKKKDNSKVKRIEKRCEHRYIYISFLNCSDNMLDSTEISKLIRNLLSFTVI